MAVAADVRQYATAMAGVGPTVTTNCFAVHRPDMAAGTAESVLSAAGYKAFGKSRPGAVLCWVAGAAVSIVAAWVLQRTVEAPAIRWARRVPAPERVAEPDPTPS